MRRDLSVKLQKWQWLCYLALSVAFFTLAIKYLAEKGYLHAFGYLMGSAGFAVLAVYFYREGRREE